MAKRGKVYYPDGTVEDKSDKRRTTGVDWFSVLLAVSLVILLGLLLMGGLEASNTMNSDVVVVDGEEQGDVLVVVQSVEEEYIVVPMERVVDASDCEVRGDECWLFAEGERVTVDVSGGYSFEVTAVQGAEEGVVGEYPGDE